MKKPIPCAHASASERIATVSETFRSVENDLNYIDFGKSFIDESSFDASCFILSHDALIFTCMHAAPSGDSPDAPTLDEN